MLYNTRTSRMIAKWFQLSGRQMLHQRILKAVHRGAWRESVAGSGLDETLLLELRTQRSRVIWEAVKADSLKRRREENFVHSRTGHIQEWEDALIQHYGIHWRQQREKLSGQTEWRSKCREFINGVSEAWGLPSLSTKAGASTASHSPAKESMSAEPPIAQNLEIRWSSSRDRFLFVVDCQPLQRIACGHTALLNDNFRPLMHRVLENVAGFISQGMMPPSDIRDPIMWTPRENNKLADYLCNRTMDDVKGEWREVRDYSAERARNVVVFSDGGTRADCSASAWALCVVIGQTLHPVIAAGIFFQVPISSFAAEAIALDNATREFRQWLQ